MASVSDLFVGPAPLLIAGYRSKISFSLKFIMLTLLFHTIAGYLPLYPIIAC